MSAGTARQISSCKRQVLILSPRKLTWTFICIAALLAARCFAWAEALSKPRMLSAGALETVELGDAPVRFEFVPGAGSVYDVCVFPAEGFESAEAVLSLDGVEITRGEGSLTLLSERLSANAACTLDLTGSGRARVEVARHALSRCFDMPMALNANGDSYAKAIARSGDVHWYGVTAEESHPVVLVGLPEEPGMRLEARLFSDSGRLLAEATTTAGGAFLMDFMPRAGRTYRIRVSDAGGGTGLYSLRVAPLDGGLPEAVLLTERDIRLEGHESHRLEASVTPEGASGVLFWESSDDSVARVSRDGTVTGLRSGAAVITAYAAGAVRARCRVEVARVPVTGIQLISSDIHMNVGDDLALEWRLIPENASDTGVAFEIEPEGVARVDGSGVVTALKEGEATIRLSTADGGYEGTAQLRVHPAEKRWRALLVGEKNYAPQAAAIRLGSANSVAGMRSMLNHLSFDGARFEVATRLDISREAVLKAIAEAFEGAGEGDTSVFYITCHGWYNHGMTCFQMVDGSVLTAHELRLALDKVPGDVVVLADCCGSGGVIGKSGAPEDVLRGILEVFGGVRGPSLFSGSRYRVLASASVEQDSYRIGFDAENAETGMATAFARAVCEGCGWSIERAARGAMRADIDGDGAVSLEELYAYAARRVSWYLSLNETDYAQTVRIWPEGDTRGLFAR